LLCRASVERPHGAVLEATAEVSQNFGFATQALNRMIPIQPDVLQFRFCHGPVVLWGNQSLALSARRRAHGDDTLPFMGKPYANDLAIG